MSNVLGNMPPVFGSGYRGVVPAPSAADVSAQNILRADGTWGAGPSGTLPSQTGNSGELLTTDGTNASWTDSLNNFSVSNLTFGVGGPNARSSIAARAARQGLVFDGTNQATMSVPMGTSDATIALWVRSDGLTNGERYLITNTNSTQIYNAGGGSVSLYTSGGAVTITNSLADGKLTLLVVSISGTTATPYVNGIAGTSGTISADRGTANVLGGTYSDYAKGFLAPLIYNRALSAAEVVALYEAGVPAGADFNTASNTNIITGDSWYNVNTGTVSSGTITLTSGQYALNSGTIVAGKRYRVTYNVTALTGTVQVGNTSATVPVVQTLTSGAGSFEFTANDSVAFGFNATAGTATITSVVLVRVGLLLAPDAGQAGGGLTWYDTSGNAADITLPASGVTWNVPSSQKTASGWTYGGNLTVSGTGTTGGNLRVRNALGYATGIHTGTTSDSTQQLLLSSNAAYNHAYISKGSTTLGIGFSSDNGSFVADDSITITAATKLVTLAGNLTVSGTGTSSVAGKLFIAKTTPDSGNGVLQLATHTTSAGGIGFGTDTSLYRSQTGMLALDGLTGSLSQLDLRVGGVQKAFVAWNGGDFYLGAVVGTTVIRSSNTTALTLDSSQNATFAGTVKIANTAEIKGVYTTTTTFDFGTIANNDASSVCTLTMTGVSSSDSIIVSPTDGDNFPQFCTVSAVPSGNTVAIRLYNGSGSSRTVGSRSIRVTAIKF